MGQNAPRSSDNIFRFDRFEANRDSYQLRSAGRTVKLERIPLELLFLLLENRGKLVDREQMVSRLWTDHSFLDTERSINTAIRKIRKALKDDPRHPRFIETVIGKGYRFIAPLVPERKNPPPETGMLIAAQDARQHSFEIRLGGFSVETTGRTPVLTCDVMVGKIALGRFPLLELELPADVTLPLKPKDRFLLKLHGVRVTLTAKATQALHAVSISALQSGLRTRATDHLPPSEDSRETGTAVSQ
jgi:DNA-binding winged helix-turn-helix (wHTH) protein